MARLCSRNNTFLDNLSCITDLFISFFLVFFQASGFKKKRKKKRKKEMSKVHQC